MEPTHRHQCKLDRTVQRRAARWVTHDYSSYSSVTQMITTLGWRSLEQRRADARLLMFYKIVHGLVEIPLPTYIQRQIRMTRTTHSYHFIQIQTSSNYYKYSFFPLAIVQWNNLPYGKPSAHLFFKPKFELQTVYKLGFENFKPRFQRKSAH